MIITDNDIDIERLLNNPIYLLTGDLETAKFYSSLASASIKLGYYVEDIIKESINLPIFKDIGSNNTVFGIEERYILIKPKFGSEIPDMVLVDETTMTIHVYEIKVNLRNADSKKAHGEKIKYQTLKDYLDKKYPEYSINIFVVDFLGTGGGATSIYEDSDIIEVITGINFCKSVDIDYDNLMKKIKYSQVSNREFIHNYKKIPLASSEKILEHQNPPGKKFRILEFRRKKNIGENQFDLRRNFF